MPLIRTAQGISEAPCPAWLYTLLARAGLSPRLRLGPEDHVCIPFADRLRAWSMTGQLKGCWTHIPHEVGGGGGRASEARYAVAKALGLVAGSGDYVFTWPGGGGWIEAKSKDGRLNPAQKNFKLWAEREGIPYRVMRTPEEGEAILREWGVLT